MNRKLLTGAALALAICAASASSRKSSSPGEAGESGAAAITFKEADRVPSASASSTGPLDPNIFVSLAKKSVPSVVNISTLSAVKSPYGRGGPDDLFRRFFEDYFRNHGGMPGGGDEDEGDDAPPAPQLPPKGQKGGPRAMSLGTGFVIDSSGLILTNNHVVADADEIKIQFTEETEEKPTDGQVVGRDPELDLALIRVKTKRQLVPMVLGDSDALEVGEYVVAVGNPFGQGHSVTHGIISAKERVAPDFALAKYLQTDAPINPGNSGGPLVNLKGEVIGINNAIDQRAHGIGFAIPISLVKKVLPQLKSKGTVTRGYIGVLVGEMTPELAAKLGVSKDLRAPFVTHVYPGEPADKAGLKPYDIILEFNGKPVRNPGDLVTAVTAIPVNDSVPVKIQRGSQEKTVHIKIGQRPGAEKLQTGDQPDSGKKKEKKPSQPDVGMELDELTPEVRRDLALTDKINGVVVISTSYGGAADSAGLLRGDVIVEVDQKPIKNLDEFFKVVKDQNKSYLLRVRRADPQSREAYTVVVLDLKQKSEKKEK